MKTIKYAFGLLLVLVLSSFTAPKENSTCKKVDASLTGVILDAKTGEALAGVEVAIEGTDLKTYTNFDGEFTFAGIKPGDYKINTRYVSYKSTDLKTISIQSNEVHALNVELQAESNEAPVQIQAKSENKTASNQLASK